MLAHHRPLRTGLYALILAVSLSPIACSGESDEPSYVPDYHDDGSHDGTQDDGTQDDGPIGSVSSALVPTDTVATAVASNTCATSVVNGLSTQLVNEIQCLRPNTFARIDKMPGLALGSSVMPFMQTKAAQALIAAQKARGTKMTINSALRTLPAQYILYRWYQTGRCGISLAASPGTSNHEGGIAVDINDNAGWRSAMQGKSFRWLGASDPVHYDFVGGGTVNLRGLSVRAFQRLWNRNRPNDTIAEDGSYGPATAARLAQSPIGGFPKGADCTKPAVDAGADSGSEDGGTDPAEVPMVPDATEQGDDDTTQSATTTTPSAEGPTEAPAADAGGCAVSAESKTSGSTLALTLGVAAALVLASRRRRQPT